MLGTDQPNLVLQERDRRLMERLAEMRIVDRDQASAVAGFRSVTRANERLRRLTLAGFLNRLFIGTLAGGKKALYTLSNKGRGVVGSLAPMLQRSRNKVLVADTFIEHQLSLNSIFVGLHFGLIPLDGARVKRWTTFVEPLSANARIVPDAYFEIESPQFLRPMFLEVDQGTEGRRTWQKKIEAYLRLAVSGEFVNQFGHSRFGVLVVTNSRRRLEELRRLIATSTQKIFWFSSIDSINREGFWSPIWFRPNGDERFSLL